jgi:hypothetical protein
VTIVTILVPSRVAPCGLGLLTLSEGWGDNMVSRRFNLICGRDFSELLLKETIIGEEVTYTWRG